MMKALYLGLRYDSLSDMTLCSLHSNALYSQANSIVSLAFGCFSLLASNSLF